MFIYIYIHIHICIIMRLSSEDAVLARCCVFIAVHWFLILLLVPKVAVDLFDLFIELNLAVGELRLELLFVDCKVHTVIKEQLLQVLEFTNGIGKAGSKSVSVLMLRAVLAGSCECSEGTFGFFVLLFAILVHVFVFFIRVSF